MKSKIRKLSHAILSLLIVFTSIFTVTPVLANETSENDLVDTITRLGTYEEVFGNPKARNNNPSLGELYSKVNGVDNGLGYSYVAHLYINGETVFCIEPTVLFNKSGDYPVSYTAWMIYLKNKNKTFGESVTMDTIIQIIRILVTTLLLNC